MSSSSKPRCSRCGSENLVKDGVQNTSDGRGPNGQQRYRCKDCGCRGTGAPMSGTPGISEARSRRAKERAEARVAAGEGRFVITSAQNATPVHKGFFKALRIYCERRRAQLIVIPYRYKNPTSIWSAAAQDDDWWAPELAPYLVDHRINLDKHLQLLGDIKTQPTAVNPLLGYESVSGAQSAIIGHPKLELKTVATPQSSLPKILTTTGAVTQKNYIQGKAGKLGEFHHTFGACVVELKNGLFHLRQINALDDGSFIDLTEEYSPHGVAKAGRALALVMGDTHQEFVDPNVVKATFDGPNSIVSILKPQHLVWHDLHDFYSRNHHHRGEVFINYVKHHSGHDNVAEALAGTFAFVDRVSPPDAINIIVKSNHPDALGRWIKESDPRQDPRTASSGPRPSQQCATARAGRTAARARSTPSPSGEPRC